MLLSTGQPTHDNFMYFMLDDATHEVWFRSCSLSHINPYRTKLTFMQLKNVYSHDIGY